MFRVFCLILSISYLHHSFEVYQSVNIDVPIGYLDCGIPYALLCLACFVYDDDHVNYVVTVLRSKLHIEE